MSEARSDAISPDIDATDTPRPVRASRQRAPLRRLLHPLALTVVMVVAAALRLYDLNWDQSQYNHPDERHVTNVISALHMPASLGEYFDSGTSPLNPYNVRASWVYGTLPLFGGRLLGEFLDRGCAPTNAFLPQLLGRIVFGAAAADCNTDFFTGYEYIRLVGRLLSALADVVTVLVVYLTGRRLFGWRVGLLAAALSALAVLQIQHSKFFVVESLLTMCVAWCLYFCARIATTQVSGRQAGLGLWINVALAGVFSGFAVACKVSAWPTAALIIVAIVIALLRDRRPFAAAVVGAWVAVLIAGVVTFASFRVAQPYGFVGNSALEWQYTTRDCAFNLDQQQVEICQQTPPMPETVSDIVTRLPAFIRPVLAPSARWIADLQSAAAAASGQQDPPFGWQWANRTPVVFPLINLVFYGMGLFLGGSAVIGVFYMLRQWLRGRRWWAYAIPVLWTLGFFLYQSTQFVKSIRYLLPIYPMLCIGAAVLLVAVWRAGGRQTLPSIPRDQALPQGQAGRLDERRSIIVRRLASAVSAIAIPLVLVGTAGWTLAFMNIYRGEMTRTEASRWIYDNVPTAATLTWRDPSGERQLQLPIPEIDLRPGETARGVLFRLDSETDRINGNGPVNGVAIRLNQIEGAGDVEARIFESASGIALGAVKQTADGDHVTFAFDGVRLQPDVDYVVEFALTEGQSLSARTSVIANQHWDEGVPFRIDGKDGFGSYYRGLTSTSDGQMQVYNEDDPAKLDMLLRGLDEADYLVLNSNRHYGSVARLPWRFPLTNAYFQALMGGGLGFELAADFYRFPQLGPFVFNDQEMPQQLVRSANTEGTPPGIAVPYPPAEEAFSVYDHPRVLIFRKTPQYSRENAEKILGVYDLQHIVRQSAFEASNTPGGLLLDQQTLAAQQAGGTWRDLFPRSSPLNQSQPLAVLAWVALIEVLGVAAFLIIASATKVSHDASRVTSHASLLDGGYAFGKTLGLLLVAFVSWWLGSVKIVQFTPLAIWCLVGVLVGVGAVVGHLNRGHILALLRERWPVFVAAEVVFLVAFVFFLLIRAGNPDLWHPYLGGEKPMDFAYFNSILKATWFPPQDPWFAGGAINYYYFGFVLIGAPVKALGIDPAVAYNIVLPTLFALVATGAFGLGTSFYASRRINTETQRNGEAQSQLEEEDSHQPSNLPTSQPLNLRNAIVAGVIAALFVAFVGNGDQIRVVGPALQQLGGASPDGFAPVAFIDGLAKWIGGAPLPIAPWWPYWNPTRPAPEVTIAEFPNFTFLYADLHAHMMAMPLAFLALACALAFAGGARRWPAVLLGAIATGMLWPTNTWDYPPYVLLGAAGLALGAFADREREPLTLRRIANRLVQSLPVIVVFVVLSRAVMVPYLANYGAAYNSIDPWRGSRTQINTFITIYALFLIPLGAALLWQLFSDDDGTRRRMQVALALGIVAGLALLIGGVPIAAIAAPMALLSLGAAFVPGQHSQTRLLWLMTCGAWAVTLFVELFVLRGDIERMNTQFKFYIQAWLMLGVASSVALVWVAEGLLDVSRFTSERVTRKTSNVIFRTVFAAVTAVAFFLAALYPAFAIPAKVDDRYVKTAPRGLDGMAYMQHAANQGHCAKDDASRFPLVYDYDAIRWMQDNVIGSPTIIEEGAAQGNQYCWSARFSIYTGLPSVVGWQWHQQQQRAAIGMQTVTDRVDDVHAFYSTTAIEEARAMLQRYDVRYIMLGGMERIYNDPAGLAKFSDMVERGELSIAYQNEGTTIYQVNR